MSTKTSRRTRKAGRTIEVLGSKQDRHGITRHRLRITTNGRVGFYQLTRHDSEWGATSFILVRSGDRHASPFELFVCRDGEAECQCRDFIWSGKCRHTQIIEQMHQEGTLP